MLTITTEIRRAMLDAKGVSIRNNQGKGTIELRFKNGANLTLEFDACQRDQNAQWHEDYAYQDETEWQIVKQIIRKNDQVRFTFCTNLYQNQHEKQMNMDHDTLSLFVLRGNKRFIVPISHSVVPQSISPSARMVAAV